MSGFFGIASREDCVTELFYGVDYHSHLGTKRGGMAVYGERGFDNAIHNISNAPFRTKFELEANEMQGNIGIGVISDYEPQPWVLQSHLGSFVIATVGVINNTQELLDILYAEGSVHFQEMKGGEVNPTELVGALICKKATIVEGIRYVQGLIDGSMSILVMTKEGIYAARDRLGRTPVIVGHKEGSFCVASESFAYMNLGYTDYHELGPAEIYYFTAEEGKTLYNFNKGAQTLNAVYGAKTYELGTLLTDEDIAKLEKQAKQSLSPVAKFFVKQGKKILASAQAKVAPAVEFVQNIIPEKPALTGEITYKLAMGKNKDGETLYFAGGVDNARLCVTSDINLAVDLHAELITKNVEITKGKDTKSKTIVEGYHVYYLEGDKKVYPELNVANGENHEKRIFL